MVFATPDQKAFRITSLVAEEVVLIFGVPECLLSDCGTNLLSHLMKDICELLLAITKLNTTRYHPQCNEMVKRFNWTLITMLRKRADKYGEQWDKHLPGVLWAYRMHPMSQLVKNHLICYLGATADHPQKQFCCHLPFAILP